MGRQRSAQSNSRKVDDQPLDKSSESAYLFFCVKVFHPKLFMALRSEYRSWVWKTNAVIWEQCDQIGRFLKVLGTKLYFKSSPKTCVTFWGITIWKNCCSINLGIFWKHLGNIFTPISGHTVLGEAYTQVHNWGKLVSRQVCRLVNI